jgi:hypothetical protein
VAGNLLVSFGLAFCSCCCRFCFHFFGGGMMTDFTEWRDRINAAYVPAPRTYQEAYAKFLERYGEIPAMDKASGFHAGWLAACDALANRLVEWLDEPAGDDVAAFLGFVADLRKGNLS